MIVVFLLPLNPAGKNTEDKMETYEIISNSSRNAVLYEKRKKEHLKVIHLLHIKL